MAPRRGRIAAKDDVVEQVEISEEPVGSTNDPDSVDQEFGNEYSEDTLNILRGVQRPAYLEETPSLDPVSELDLYVENNVNLPPSIYDSIQNIGKEEIQVLEKVKEYEPDADATAATRYRQQLADGANHQDMTWLKLRAYYRAKDELNGLEKNEQATGSDSRDAGPEPPSSVEQLAHRRKLEVMAAAKIAREAAMKKSAVERILSRPEPSEESEWENPSTSQQGILQEVRQALLGSMQLALAARSGAVDMQQQKELQKHSEEDVSMQEQYSGPVAQFGSVIRREPRTIYAKAYEEEKELNRLLGQQARQRRAAFWLSFLSVSGAFIARSVRRYLLKKGKKNAGRSNKDSAARVTA